jgi:hypothetical protein
VASVKADLEQATRLALFCPTWKNYLYPGVESLPRDLSMFPALKELFLVQEEDYDVFDTPGYIVLRDLPKPLALEKRFLDINKLEKKEKTEGAPEMRFVSAHRITHIPGDSQERDYGEPFVSTRKTHH